MVPKREKHTSSWESLSHILREPPSPFTTQHEFKQTSARTGDRRLRQPEALPPYDGYNYVVQHYGNSCPQQAFTLPEVFNKVPQLGNVINGMYSDIMRDAEDCKAHAMSPSLAELNHLSKASLSMS